MYSFLTAVVVLIKLLTLSHSNTPKKTKIQFEIAKPTALVQAFLKQGDNFSGRPMSLLMEELSGNEGIVFRDAGPDWKVQKKFGAASLKRYVSGSYANLPPAF